METLFCEYCKKQLTEENAGIPIENGKFAHPICDQEHQKSLSNKSSNVLLEDMEATFAECLAIAKRKNNDYAGEKTVDPYKNLKGSIFVGVSPDRAILVRIMDKMSRVSNLLSQDNQVKDESISDTINDVINYMAILKSYLKTERERKSKEPPYIPLSKPALELTEKQ